MGQFIATELLGQGASVVALTRGDNNEIVSLGIPQRVVDYSSLDSLIGALKDVDVVVSTVNGPGFYAQRLLADAAKHVGVKLFVPSEFGVCTQKITWGPMMFKPEFHRYLDSINLPRAIFYNGAFSDVGARWGVDIPNKTATIVGAGTTPMTWTARADIAGFVAYVLTHLPPEELHGKVFGIEGSRATFMHSVSLVEKHKLGGEKFRVEHRDAAMVRKEVEANGMAGIPDFVALLIEDGTCNVEDFKANHLFPGFKPMSLDDAIAKYW